MSTDDAVAALAERVAQLEQRLDAAGASDELVPTDIESRFWILHGLQARAEVAVVYAGIVDQGTRGTVEWQMGHTSDDLLEESWTDRAVSLSALGHPVRMQILQLIARGQAETAADLARTEDLGTTGQIYHHLRQLVSAGWLRSTAKGRHQIPPERLVPLLVILGASR